MPKYNGGDIYCIDFLRAAKGIRLNIAIVFLREASLAGKAFSNWQCATI